MSDSKTISPGMEPVHNHHSHLLCWKSIFAGLLISILSYMILSALAVGILGTAAQSAIENETGGMALATAAGLSMGLSAVISLFLGSYFAVRISKFVTNKVGAAHGFVIASAFFVLLALQVTSTIGSISRGVGHLVGGMGQGVAMLSSNPRVQDTINQALGSATLKSDAKTVTEGMAIRLLRGDVESAKSYYAYQTGLTASEVDVKVAQLQADFTATAKAVGDQAAEAAAATGWSLFATFVVGAIAALIGGRVGAHSNVERPLTAVENETSFYRHTNSTLANQNGSALPYIFGWLLGVPASILFLIFMLRAIF